MDIMNARREQCVDMMLGSRWIMLDSALRERAAEAVTVRDVDLTGIR